MVGSLVRADAAGRALRSLAENSACSLVQALAIQYHYLAAAYRHYAAGNKPTENLIRCGTSSSGEAGQHFLGNWDHNALIVSRVQLAQVQEPT